MFTDLINKLKSTNSSTEKKAILSSYKDNEYIKQALKYILDPYFKYYITQNGFFNYHYHHEYDTFEKTDDYKNVFELLDDLRYRKITWHKALDACFVFYQTASEDDKEVLIKAFDKDLDCWVWASLINQVFVTWGNDSFIPVFEVPRAYKIEDVLKDSDETLDFSNKKYVASRKLDGIRCIAMFNGSEFQFFTREWNEILSLRKLKNTLEESFQKNGMNKKCVIDGELCIIDENWKEDFKAVVSEFRKKEHTIENPFFYIFDFIPYEEFINWEGPSLFKDRYQSLQENKAVLTTKYSGLLDFSDVLETQNDLDILISKAKENQWEGLILRDINSSYKGKRTKDLIKVKKFSDAEFQVHSLEFSKQGVLENGIMVDKDILARLNILYKWNIVWVWTWFTQEERLYYYEHPEEIIGKNVTIQYMEESVDKNGTPSLRHPSFKWIRDYE